jgi:hypothetical protein
MASVAPPASVSAAAAAPIRDLTLILGILMIATLLPASRGEPAEAGTRWLLRVVIGMATRS